MFLVFKMGSMPSLIQMVEILSSIQGGVLQAHVAKCMGNPISLRNGHFFPLRPIFITTGCSDCHENLHTFSNRIYKLM